jgi:hypothetical protein
MGEFQSSESTCANFSHGFPAVSQPLAFQFLEKFNNRPLKHGGMSFFQRQRECV